MDKKTTSKDGHLIRSLHINIKYNVSNLSKYIHIPLILSAGVKLRISNVYLQQILTDAQTVQ